MCLVLSVTGGSAQPPQCESLTSGKVMKTEPALTVSHWVN